MGDRPFFVAGNVWLLAALVLRLGQKAVGYAPGYAFFGVGGRLSSAAYWFLIVVCVIIGVALMSARRRP